MENKFVAYTLYVWQNSEKKYIYEIFNNIYLKITYKKDLSDAKSSNEKSKNMLLEKIF